MQSPFNGAEIGGHAAPISEATEPLDDDSILWEHVVEATFVVRQRFRYEYPGPIADLHHRLMIVPRERHGDQKRIASRLDVSPPASSHDDHDAFGNPVATFFARRIERSIEFAHLSIVTRTANVAHLLPSDVLEDTALTAPTALTACDAALRDAARTLRAAHDDPVALATAINAYVFAEMVYTAGVTDVETTAIAAFGTRRGVCQDYAHIMIALARRVGLCARYVSGHLLGEGGTHAWVEVIVPAGAGAMVIAYDPTHGRLVNMRYVVIAVGRDYSDVAPTSGVFTAPYNGELTATKRVGATHVKYASPEDGASFIAAAS
jgi:transglutaminase-like putative cysteine protease